MYCKNCGNEIKEGAKKCEVCGYSYEEENKVFSYENLKEKAKCIQEKIKTNKNSKIYIIGGIVIITAIFILFSQSNSLNKYENQIYEGCLELKWMMKDPDSFTLYENAAAIENEEDGNVYSIVEYGGVNSYGATIKGEAVFLNGEYMFDTDEEIEVGESKRITSAKLEILQIMYGIQLNGSPTGYKVTKVNLDKVINKLNIE